MVHSGGFSIAERQSTPKLLPTKLHWFRWKALRTWISGFLLLGLLYYSLRDAGIEQQAVNQHGRGHRDKVSARLPSAGLCTT
jgi:uncharacterized membrane protein